MRNVLAPAAGRRPLPWGPDWHGWTAYPSCHPSGLWRYWPAGQRAPPGIRTWPAGALAPTSAPTTTSSPPSSTLPTRPATSSSCPGSPPLATATSPTTSPPSSLAATPSWSTSPSTTSPPFSTRPSPGMFQVYHFMRPPTYDKSNFQQARARAPPTSPLETPRDSSPATAPSSSFCPTSTTPLPAPTTANISTATCNTNNRDWTHERSDSSGSSRSGSRSSTSIRTCGLGPETRKGRRHHPCYTCFAAWYMARIFRWLDMELMHEAWCTWRGMEKHFDPCMLP
mmetsp:Transcript_105791/g.321052  ORF Transcript_105791/g.321052 Transcript_105791/m.321052 type:complete len:283 (+) Transcript_105791:76-924(+)